MAKGIKKRKKSIRTQFLASVIWAILIVAFSIGGMSMWTINEIIIKSASDVIRSSCEKSAALINDELGDIEKIVNVFADYARKEIDDPYTLYDEETREAYKKTLNGHFFDISTNAEDAFAYFFRFAEDFDGRSDGFFSYIKQDGSTSGKYNELKSFTPDKTPGWYTDMMRTREAAWTDPYFEAENDTYNVSYAVPVYKDGIFFAIVGIGMDYSKFTKKIDNIEVIGDGYAYLSKNFKIAYHKDLPIGSSKPSDKSSVYEVSSLLENGMSLIVSISYDSINSQRYRIEGQVILTAILMILLFALIHILIVGKITHPIKKMTDAAKEISCGKYDINIGDSNFYEIDMLRNAIEKMAAEIGEHEKQYRILAFSDSLTGLQNSTAYNAFIEECDERIVKEGYKPAIVVLDINGLKNANDEYGHEAGDILIREAAEIIAATFTHSRIFRFGGDEFTVVLEGDDLKNWTMLVTAFDNRIENESIMFRDCRIPVRIARGIAFFNPDIDKRFSDIFNRADNAMYENKKHFMQ